MKYDRKTAMVTKTRREKLIPDPLRTSVFFVVNKKKAAPINENDLKRGG
jgi:hypothetical protein